MEKYFITAFVLYALNSCWWVYYAFRMGRKLDKALTDLSYTSKVQRLNSEDIVTPQARAMRAQTDVQAAIKSASRDEHIEVHNSENLGEDIIIDDDRPLNRKAG